MGRSVFHFRWFVIMALLAVTGSSCDPPASTRTTAATGTITGQTLSSGGNPPLGIAGIDVYLSGVEALTVTSDEAGRYTFSGLSPGMYSVQAKGSGLGSNEYDLTVQANMTVTQNLVLFIFHQGGPTPTLGPE